MHAWSTSMLLLLHSAFILSVVKMLLKGEVGGRAVDSHGNYIVDYGKSWNCVFEFLWKPCYMLQGSRCVNQIEEVCRDIEKTINQTIQTTLNSLERDCDLIASTVETRLKDDRSGLYKGLNGGGVAKIINC